MIQRDERMSRLAPEAKVAIAIDMIDSSARISSSAIRDRNPDISDQDLLNKLRERVNHSKRRRQFGG